MLSFKVLSTGKSGVLTVWNVHGSKIEISQFHSVRYYTIIVNIVSYSDLSMEWK